MHALHCANDGSKGGDDNDFKKMIVKIKMENYMYEDDDEGDIIKWWWGYRGN